METHGFNPVEIPINDLELVSPSEEGVMPVFWFTSDLLEDDVNLMNSALAWTREVRGELDRVGLGHLMTVGWHSDRRAVEIYGYEEEPDCCVNQPMTVNMAENAGHPPGENPKEGALGVQCGGCGTHYAQHTIWKTGVEGGYADLPGGFPGKVEYNYVPPAEILVGLVEAVHQLAGHNRELEAHHEMNQLLTGALLSGESGYMDPDDLPADHQSRMNRAYQLLQRQDLSRPAEPPKYKLWLDLYDVEDPRDVEPWVPYITSELLPTKDGATLGVGDPLERVKHNIGTHNRDGEWIDGCTAVASGMDGLEWSTRSLRFVETREAARQCEEVIERRYGLMYELPVTAEQAAQNIRNIAEREFGWADQPPGPIERRPPPEIEVGY